MGYIDQAVKYGYQAKEILDRLLRDNPEFASRAGQAIAAGYTAEQILQSVARNFQGKSGRRSAKALGIRPQYARNLAFSEDLDPATVIPEAQRGDASGLQRGIGTAVGTGLGAAAGAIAGGPMGALRGAAAGGTAGADLLSSYERHRQEGGQLSFADFAKAAAKGSGASYAVGTIANQFTGSNQAKDSPGLQEEPAQPSPQESEPAQPESVESAATAQPTITPEQAVEILRANNVLDRATVTAQNNTDDVVAKVIKATTNRAVDREIQKKHGVGIEEVTLAALPMLRGEQSGSQTPDLGSQTQESAVQAEQASGVKPLDTETNLRTVAFENIFTPPLGDGADLGRVQPIADSLKSSNVLGAKYFPDTQKMRVVFQTREGRKGGTVYEYDNVDEATFNKFTQGKATPVTEGENVRGIWFRGKNKSIGAAFHEHIRKNADKFPPKKQNASAHSVSENQIIEADRALLATELFEPIKEIREQGRAIVSGAALKDKIGPVEGMDDEFFEYAAYLLRDELKKVLKNPPKIERLEKEFRKAFL